MQAPAAPVASRVDSVMAAEAADSVLNPDETEAEAQVTATTEANTALALVQAPAATAAASRVDSVMAAEAP